MFAPLGGGKLLFKLFFGWLKLSLVNMLAAVFVWGLLESC